MSPPSLQRRILAAALSRARRLPGFAGAVLVGSLARGDEDRLSDVEGLIFVRRARSATRGSSAAACGRPSRSRRGT
ncbi:MAG: hypothetical protein ACRDF0_04840 [Candidatus Limnocylindria bacterium]